MRFIKYHALGNDYIVLDPKDFPEPLTAERIRLICHRNFGVGSDGILYGPLPSGLKMRSRKGARSDASGP